MAFPILMYGSVPASGHDDSSAIPLDLVDRQWRALRSEGWTLTGLLIGAAPAAFDYFSAVLRHEERPRESCDAATTAAGLAPGDDAIEGERARDCE